MDKTGINPPVIIRTGYQSAGKGQGNNSWISEREQNLLLSYVFEPKGLKAENFFRLSVIISLSIYNLLSNMGLKVLIKWPNDLLIGEEKIAGILIENMISGKWISRCVAGIGLNINQVHFPGLKATSLSLNGISSSPGQLCRQLVSEVRGLIPVMSSGGFRTLYEKYHQNLYRLNTWSDFSDDSGRFRGQITGVEPGGNLRITDSKGKNRSYGFREVDYL
jgi:BirA family biotin operon repressor/biotin-[acetyl-CoA-carboxylase] ligase